MKVQVEMALRNVRQHLHSLELDPEVVPILPASRHLFAVASCTALHTLRCAPGWGVGLRCRAHVSHSRSVWQPECGLLRRCTDGQASRARSIGISGQTRRFSCIGGGLLQIPSCGCNIAGPHASAKVGFANQSRLRAPQWCFQDSAAIRTCRCKLSRICHYNVCTCCGNISCRCTHRRKFLIRKVSNTLQALCMHKGLEKSGS